MASVHSRVGQQQSASSTLKNARVFTFQLESSSSTCVADIADLQPRHYGWQNGAFFAKYTHWVEVLIVLYFGVSITSQYLPDIKHVRMNLLAMLIPMTLYLDIGFFLAVYPVRLTGKSISSSPDYSVALKDALCTYTCT
eukprot:1614024-Pyramimonas_sp.AAC.1